MKTALYRHFNKDDELLYVGISLSVVNRLSQHFRSSKWSSEISKITIEYFKNRELASRAERSSIILEKPLFNIVYNDKYANDNVPEIASNKKEFIQNIYREDGVETQVVHTEPNIEGALLRHTDVLMMLPKLSEIPKADFTIVRRSGKLDGDRWIENRLFEYCDDRKVFPYHDCDFIRNLEIEHSLFRYGRYKERLAWV